MDCSLRTLETESAFKFNLRRRLVKDFMDS